MCTSGNYSTRDVVGRVAITSVARDPSREGNPIVGVTFSQPQCGSAGVAYSVRTVPLSGVFGTGVQGTFAGVPGNYVNATLSVNLISRATFACQTAPSVLVSGEFANNPLTVAPVSTLVFETQPPFISERSLTSFTISWQWLVLGPDRTIINNLAATLLLGYALNYRATCCTC